MLNISEHSISREVDRSQFASLDFVEKLHSGKVLLRSLSILFGILFGSLFLPWTQNISTRGSVTTLRPDQRPQTINSVIAGRIERWFVREGDYVNRGDTILFLSEVKDDYFDPELLARTQQQLTAKQQAVGSYQGKVGALDQRITALLQTSRLKLEQTQNKLQQSRLKVLSDSIEYQAAVTNFDIAQLQFDRLEKLYQDGLKSLTDLEKRKLTLQKAQAEMIAKENKLLTSRNEVINAQIELTSIDAQYQDYIAKANSDKFTALSSKFDAEATVSKLQNQYSNYQIRTGLYYVLAPQDGYITKAIQSGLGETIKEGAEIVSIMPARYDLAVEMYVKPLDLPLLARGEKVRIQFDGWPAIVFSGWPNTSVGTYGGLVFAMDNFISDNGMYRVLVAPDPNEATWPEALRVGAGTHNMVLLKDVRIWYELWRQINGFPPDYYQGPDMKNDSSKKK